MNIYQIHVWIAFLINSKIQGSYFSPEEVDQALDFAQMSLFNNYYDQFGLSQRLNDALAPFKGIYQFTATTCPNGLITMPTDYEHLLSAYITQFDNTYGVKQIPIEIVSEDQVAIRQMSQLIPMAKYPFGLVIKNWNVQLYPSVPSAGTVYYLSRPPVPKMAYGLVSGRVPVYDPSNSTQMAWASKDLEAIVVKAINYLGINFMEKDVVGWSSQSDKDNITGGNRA